MKMFLLYDGRAWKNPDDALVLCTADSEEEARRDSQDHPPDSVWYEYQINGDKLINGKIRPDLSLQKRREK